MHSPTVYERVMSNPVSRAAYYNCTDGTLYGREGDPAIQQIKEVFNKYQVAYLINYTKYKPRPEYMTQNAIRVGAADIIAYAELIYKPRYEEIYKSAGVDPNS